MPSPRLIVALLLPALAGLASGWPDDAEAQIRRCTAPDGTSVFTDQRCEDVDSVARLPDISGSTGSRAGALRPRCMRSVDELVMEMTLAFDARDGNHLAGLYHWTGMSSGSGYATIERLDRMVQRPLVGIVPVLPSESEPESAPAAAADAATGPDMPSAPERHVPAWETWAWTGARATAADDEDPAMPTADGGTAARHEAATTPSPPPRPRPRPVALRIEQTGSNDAHATSTVFGLTRHFGCWWISG
ncbi:hypothetical protein [Marilutibacter alkalisoli]|uniref:DUF4124 domain-containing protein n=1 Tax=Marilutibacter alkalisoli TaxID=2591633 RepID=A0A514BPD0_9GAMM|nr:hypothetical protein [Lysobacter alkalisoli]QDH69247.1 hypothetical protein FKV23_03390 [Lysobacter alkalisoli]